MRSIRLCFTLAVIAAMFIAACSTPEAAPPAPAEKADKTVRKERRRLAPPESNCRFESYCQVIQLTDEPASAPGR